jgi:hypothetical protein
VAMPIEASFAEFYRGAPHCAPGLPASGSALRARQHARFPPRLNLLSAALAVRGAAPSSSLPQPPLTRRG